MSQNISLLIEAVKDIQNGGINNSGWHKATRSSDTGVGKTFEDLLGKEEDNLPDADFHDIEIKSRRKFSSSMLTLFTKSPTEPLRINSKLREKYGYGEPKRLHVTVPANRTTVNSQAGYQFQALINYEEKKIRLGIFDLEGNLIDDSVAWNFSIIDRKLNQKLKTTAIVSAETKEENGETYFKYVDVDIMTGLTLENFLRAMEDGKMFIDIRLGVYSSGSKAGKTHDYGTGFRIHARDLLEYAHVISLEI